MTLTATPSQPTARQVREEVAHLTIGDASAADQHLLTGVQIAGLQQKGSKGALKGKKVLVYGGGDVWPKFVLAPLLHLGVAPEDITIIDPKPMPEGLEWQYKGVNMLTPDKLKEELGRDPEYMKKKQFAFAVVATPPSAHASCAQQAIEKFGLPVLIEKPIFSSIEEYDRFVAFCEEKRAHVYAIDWQRAISTPLYAALGENVPFADSIEYTNKDAFTALKGQKLKEVKAIFTEGKGNALADIRHRGHLLKQVGMGKWACTGMLADMGIHPINALTGAGFQLQKITAAFFGGKSDEQGYRAPIPHSRTKDVDGEEFARVSTQMSWNGQHHVPVHFECAKGGAPNVNDGRTIFIFENGQKLVQEFGIRVNRITLFDTDGETVLATATDRGEPYERMLLEADGLFTRWKESAPNEARIAYGAESREALKVIEDAHLHACDNPTPARPMRQYALEEMRTPAEEPKADGYQSVVLGEGQYKTVSPDEVLKGSSQRHATAEGASFDAKSGCFYYVDIEHGLLVRHNPKEETRTTWKLTSDELDPDGRPKQMLAVAKINHDGSVMVLLSGGGENAGLNYFNPDTNQLRHVGKIPDWETAHPHNRPNDETTLTIGGKNYICYGTMDRHWDKAFDAQSKLQRTGAYYLLDPETLKSEKLTFENHPAPLITNGLADGGDTPDGKKILFWAETGEDAGLSGRDLKVYRGELDPKSHKVTNITTFKTHEQLGGVMNGTDAYGRPDGAKMGMYNGKPVYGISMLELGQIRFFNADPKDADYGKEALRITLPEGITRNTQFALGEDGNGKPIGLVTTQDSGYFTRRWQVNDTPGAPPEKAWDGQNGAVITFDLPKGLSAHPQAIGRVNYPDFLRVSSRATTIQPLELDASTVRKPELVVNHPPQVVTNNGRAHGGLGSGAKMQ